MTRYMTNTKYKFLILLLAGFIAACSGGGGGGDDDSNEENTEDQTATLSPLLTSAGVPPEQMFDLVDEALAAKVTEDFSPVGTWILYLKGNNSRLPLGQVALAAFTFYVSYDVDGDDIQIKLDDEEFALDEDGQSFRTSYRDLKSFLRGTNNLTGGGFMLYSILPDETIVNVSFADNRTMEFTFETNADLAESAGYILRARKISDPEVTEHGTITIDQDSHATEDFNYSFICGGNCLTDVPYDGDEPDEFWHTGMAVEEFYYRGDTSTLVEPFLEFANVAVRNQMSLNPYRLVINDNSGIAYRQLEAAYVLGADRTSVSNTRNDEERNTHDIDYDVVLGFDMSSTLNFSATSKADSSVVEGVVEFR